MTIESDEDEGCLHGCQLRWAFALLVYLPFGEINVVVALLPLSVQTIVSLVNKVSCTSYTHQVTHQVRSHLWMRP